MSVSNQFEEIEDIFRYLLKQEFINPDDIDLLAQKFKTTFLTIDNKDEFFPFLNNFVQEIEGNDMYHEERVEALKTEIESFYDRIGTNFSVYHVAGYKDPNDQDNSEKFSDEEDNFEFHNKDYLPPVFGPNIPEDKKPLVKKVIEKIASLYEQKQTRRQQVLQRWRQLRLANQIQKLKQQAPALSILQRISLKPFNAFFRIKEHVELLNKEDTEKMEEMMGKYEGEIKDLKDELAKSEQEKLKNGLQMKKDRELENRIKQLQGDLNSRLSENDKLRNLFENQKKEMSDKSKEDRLKREQMDKLNTLLQQLEKRKKMLDSEVEEKSSNLQEISQALKQSQDKINELMKEKDEWKLKFEKKDLQSFQKTRYFIKIMKLFQIRILAYGFMKIFKRKEIAKVSLMNVTQRIKARLLIQTRNIYCGQDIMKSYLKWMLKSKPDFIREYISKIPLTGRINQQVSFWRMKKLVFKPIVKKLSESVKSLRRLKGFFLLHKMFENKEFLDKYHFMMKLNPNHKNLQMNKVEKVFQRLFNNRTQALRDGLKRLKKHKDFVREMLKRMIDKNYNQMRAAFWILRMKNRQQRQMNEMIIIQNALDRMARNKRDAYREFFERLKDRNGKTIKLIQRLVEGQKGKQNNVFSSLVRNKNRLVMDEMKNKYTQRFTEMLRQGSAKLLRDTLMDQARRALRELRMNNEEQKRGNLMEEHQKEKLRKFFNNLNNKKTLLKNSALSHLRKYNQEQRDQYQRRRNLLDKMKQRIDLMKRHTFNQLRENNNRENNAQKEEKRKLNNLFSSLSRSYKAKQKQSIKCLSTNKDQVSRQNQQLRNLIQRRLFSENNLSKKRAYNHLRDNMLENRENEDLQKRLQSLAIMLKNGLNRKLKYTLMLLISKKRELQHRGKIRDMIKKNILQRYLDGQKLDKKSVFQKLIGNKDFLNDKDKREKELMRKVFLKGDKGVLGQMKRALDKLRNNRRIFKTKIVHRALFDMINGERGNLKKYFDILREFNRKSRAEGDKKTAMRNSILRRLLFNNEMKKGVVFNKFRENKNQEIIKELKDQLNKTKILYRLVMAQKAKVLQQFYRLLLNNKEEENVYQRKILKQKKFLQYLENLNDKKRHAFDSLVKFNKDAKEQKKKLRNIMATLLNTQESKKRRAFEELVKNKISSGASRDIDRLRNKYLHVVREKKIVDFFTKLERAQEVKSRSSVQILRRNNREMKDSQREGLFSKRSPLSKMMRKLFGKYRQAFNALKKNRKDQEEGDKERVRVLKAKLMVFGVGENVLDALLKFAGTLDGSKSKPYRSSPKDRYLNAIEFMENNDPDGRYQRILESVARGEIQNIDDVKNEAQKMNSTGKYQDLLKQIRNPNLEMFNIVRWLEMNNEDGKYNHLLQEMGKNPDFNKLDLLNYVDKGDANGKYNGLKGKLNFDSKADEMIQFMKKNNQQGTYSSVLDSQVNMFHPKLTNLVKYSEKDSELLPLKKKINEINAKKQMKRVIEYIKRNNGDGRYDDILKELSQSSEPKLSNASSYLRHNPTNQNESLKDKVNFKTPTLTEKAVNYFSKHNEDGKYNNLIKKLEGRRNVGIVDFYRIIADMKGDHIRDLQNYLDNPTQITNLIKFMKENNTDGNFDKILDQMKWKPNSSKTDLMKAMMKWESKCDLSSLLLEIHDEESIDELTDFMRRKNFDGKFNKTIDQLSSEQNLFEFFKYVSRNKRGLDYQSIFDKIDGHEQDDPSPIKFLERTLKENKHLKRVPHLQRKLNIMRFPSFSRCMESIIRNPDYDELIVKLNEVESPEQVDRLNIFFQNNSQNPDYYEIRQMVVQKKPLTDLFNYVEDNEGKINLMKPKQILNQDYLQDPLDECMRQMTNDNLDGKYNDLLAHLKEKVSPQIKDILEFIDLNGNQNGEYDDLLDKINNKDKKERFLKILEWIGENNDNGIYDHLNDIIKSFENPKLSDILRFASKNNKEGNYNLLLERILGRRIVPNKLIELLLKYNRKGKYDGILKYLQENPSASFDQILDELEKLNQNGEYDKVIQYIWGDNDNFRPGERDFEGMIKDLISSGEYPEVEEYLKNNKIRSPFQLLQWMEKNNDDGQYDDLIKTLTKFLHETCSNEKGVNKLGIPQAHKGKLRQCLDRLRKHNQTERKKLLDNKDKIRAMLISAQKNMKMSKMLYLNKLRNHKNDMYFMDESRVSKVRKYLNRLVNSQKGKMTSCMIKLHQNNNLLKDQENVKNAKLGKIFQNANNQYRKKQNYVLETMRSRNRLLKDVSMGNAKKMREAFHNKMKQALEKLRENNRQQNMMDKVKEQLFNKLLMSKYRDSLRNCYEALKANNDRALREEDMRQRLQNTLFKQWMNQSNNTLKKYLDRLREFNRDQEREENIKDRVKQQMMNALHNNNQNALRDIFNKLRNHNQKQKMEEDLSDRVKNQLLNAFQLHSKENLRKYLNQLRENNREVKRQEEEKDRASVFLGKGLIFSGKDAMKKAFDALRRRNMKEQMQEMQKSHAISILLDKLRNGLNKKAGHCIAHLMENSREDLNNKQKIRDLIGKLFDAQNVKVKNVFQKLLNNNREQVSKERRDRDKLKRLLEKAYNKYLQRPFYKLIENCLFRQKQDQIIKGRFGDMDKNWTLRKSSKLHEIHSNYLRHLLRDAQRKFILKTIISNYDNKKKQGLLTMLSFIYNKKSKAMEAMKVIRKNIMQDVWYFYRILKMNRFLKERNKKQQKLNSMFYCMRKNHKQVMRQAFHHWAGTDIKNKVRIGTSKLEVLIMRREHVGYHSIKKYYLYMKFEKFIQGLMKLITLIDGRVYKEKEFFMNQLLDRNLWYQRVIDIWTIKSLANHQIAFWKMRYAKDLKQDGVSAEKSLKIKKLFHLMDKKIQGILSHGFWRVQAASASNNQELKQSFSKLMANK